jgi:muramidase (phage lysozyme)
MKIANYMAFLHMLAFSEGTDSPRQKSANKGYDVLVGGGTFTDFSKHPNARIFLPKYKIHSSAAGRYQFLKRTWDVLQKRLGLKDFSPQSQDLACIELLRECGALKALDQDDPKTAISKACKIWASLPGAGYGQREEKVANLLRKYREFGGTIA